MDDQKAQKRQRLIGRLIIAGAVVGFIALIVFLQILSSGPKPSSNDNSDTSSANNEDTNTAGNKSDASTTKEGTDFSALLNVGLKTSNIDGLQYALYQYANPKNISVRNATSVFGTVTQTLPSGSIQYFRYNSDIKLDDSNTVKVEIRVNGPYKEQVIVSDKNNAKLYDSGEIDLRTL